MGRHALARWAGVIGGLCWVARAVLDRVGTDGQEGPLSWAGLALLALAFFGIGLGLADKGAAWLRLVVAICFPALVWSVLEVVHGAGDDRLIDGVFGAVVAVACIERLVRGRGRSGHSHSKGSHAR